ncbi:MAG TPA: metalloregulator ArsR/SmtB family transcription factor [Acidimicrobiales bacterium]|nr:metalloregulator ArsR/SmtB family transcription factor [Acidimicrobiales bacterium]
MARDIQQVMTALGSPVRREILALVWDAEATAGEIAAAFALTKPTISQHLAVLRQAELVTMTAVGTTRRYRARQEALDGLHAALEGSLKWTPADDLPERALSHASTKPAVVVAVEVPTDQASTFRAFTDPEVYSGWLGVPVTIDDGRFAATMEWGTEVRGVYEVVCPPELIMMRWDFEDDNVPVPGAELTGYLRVRPVRSGGSRVEVHQLVDHAEEAEFMEVAWAMVLGRLKVGVEAALDPGRRAGRRPRRSKRRTSA